jgi:hypothetical protein
VRWESKTPLAAVAVLLLAVAFAACGGGGSGTTSTEDSASARVEAASAGGANGGGEGKAGAAGGSSSGANEEAGGSGESATSFKPKHHRDSGGGSAQYRVKGGDNSIQNFGSEAGGSEFEEAAAVLHGFLDARAEGDWTAACSHLSKSTVESFEKLAAQSKQSGRKGCADILGQLINPAAKREMSEEAATADVGSLRTEGERAFLIYTGAEKTVIAIPMTKEGDVWKVASIAGTPIS